MHDDVNFPGKDTNALRRSYRPFAVEFLSDHSLDPVDRSSLRRRMFATAAAASNFAHWGSVRTCIVSYLRRRTKSGASYSPQVAKCEAGKPHSQPVRLALLRHPRRPTLSPPPSRIASRIRGIEAGASTGTACRPSSGGSARWCRATPQPSAPDRPPVEDRSGDPCGPPPAPTRVPAAPPSSRCPGKGDDTMRPSG